MKMHCIVPFSYFYFEIALFYENCEKIICNKRVNFVFSFGGVSSCPGKVCEGGFNACLGECYVPSVR
jgi:hypothetical protein